MQIDLNSVINAEKEAEQAYLNCQAHGAHDIVPDHIAELTCRLNQCHVDLTEMCGGAITRSLDMLVAVICSFRIGSEKVLAAVQMPLPIVSLLLSVLTFGASLGACALLKAPLLGAVFLASAVGVVVGSGTFAFIRYLTPDAAIQRFNLFMARQRTYWARLEACKTVERELAVAQKRFQIRKTYDEKVKHAADLRRRYQSANNQLALVNWRELRGVEFEGFLKRVFEHQGFAVATTKTSGDQGIDLIASRANLKLGIQAKGYLGSVGNDAVQQAFAGRAYYQCTHSVVITNSFFTKSARDLASSVGCYLIDGEAIPNLIAGKCF